MVRYQKLGRVELNVTHLERSRHFYEKVLGLQYVDTGPDGSGADRNGSQPDDRTPDAPDAPDAPESREESCPTAQGGLRLR